MLKEKSGSQTSGRSIEEPRIVTRKTRKLTIEGIEIEFPYNPYAIQMEFMRRMIRSFSGRKNAILQSPTGTGKTICLLCASIGWVMHQYIKNPGLGRIPIVYMSRTHSQLKQVIKELKQISYQPKTTIIGSRDQLCVNQNISNLSGKDKDGACRNLRKGRGPIGAKSCQYYHSLMGRMATIKRQHENSVLDIEDLQNLGKSNVFCPFYLSKNLVDGADIVFMPYNYALDAMKRKNLVTLFKNAIMIFDEAHNVEGSAEEGESNSITTKTVAVVIDELKRVKKILGDGNFTTPSKDSVPTGGEEEKMQLTPEEIRRLLRDIEDIEKPISYLYQGMLDLKKSYEEKHRSKNKRYRGSFRQRFSAEENTGELKTFDELARMVFACTKNDRFQSLPVMGMAANPFQGGIDRTNIKSFNEKLDKVYGNFVDSFHGISNDVERLLDFMKRIEEIGTKDQEAFRASSSPSWDKLLSNHFKANIEYDFVTSELELHIWCMIPAIAFGKIKEMNIHNFVFTSGTMDPIDGFEDLIGQTCEEKLQNPHTIDPEKQLFARVVSGYRRVRNIDRFNFSYNFRDNENLYINLGFLTVEACTKVPNGMLIFFTSYAIMNKCYNIWSSTNMPGRDGETILTRISMLKVFCKEDKERELFQDNFQLFMKNYDHKGAIFMGVFGGKLSEGIDFLDKMARMVIMVGIPYANKSSLRLQAKENYLNERSLKCFGQKCINGSQWYFNNAMRLMNQTAGRVIRHLNDFGSVLFVDERYAEARTMNNMSEWIRRNVKVCPEMALFEKELQGFFHQKKVDEQENIMLNSSNLADNPLLPDPLESEREKVLQMNPGDYLGGVELNTNEPLFHRPNSPLMGSQSFYRRGSLVKAPVAVPAVRFQPLNQQIKSSEVPKQNPFLGSMPNSQQSPATIASLINKNRRPENTANASQTATNASKIATGSNMIEERGSQRIEDMILQPRVRLQTNNRDDTPNTKLREIEIAHQSDSEEEKKQEEKKGKAGVRDGTRMFMECTVCFESENKVFLTARCGHILCEKCWDTIFQLKKKAPCPLCKKDTVKKQLVKLFAS